MAAASSVLPYPDGRQKTARLYFLRHLPSTISPLPNIGSHMFSRWKGSSRNGFA